MTDQRVNELHGRIDERYAAWETGTATSPSAADFATDALLVCGMDPDEPGPLADYLYDAACGGADARTLAMLAVGWIDKETDR